MNKQGTFINLLGEVVSIKEARKPINPVIKVFGTGPEGEKCKNCKHLFDRSFSKKYYKCAIRINSTSPKTDHRVNWPACGKFEPKSTISEL